MNERLVPYKEKLLEYWSAKSKSQKGLLVGAVVIVLILLIFLIAIMTSKNHVPLYTNLSIHETGQIKERLDAMGVSSELTNDGTTILVPEQLVDNLKVELAAEGIPSSGSIDYSFFKEQMGFGMTDNEFTVIERAAMQSELANLIRNIDGVRQASVMITLPEESVWLNAGQETSTAAIVVELAPGYELEQEQVKTMFHLVSKSVPNLPIENIGISDQMFNDYTYENSGADSALSAFEEQRAIQREIERDLTRNLQQMLGTMVGRDKVLISVTTDIDFTQENRTESLVEAVDPENVEGIAISIERITEAYSGEGVDEGGVAGTGDEIPNYPGVVGQGDSEWDREEERINNEVNRIQRDIVESPYKIRDLGIQVMIEPPDGLEALPLQQENDIRQILATIVRTSISEVYTEELTPEVINEKIVVSSQPFDGKMTMDIEPTSAIPAWLYIVGGVLIALIILLFVLLMRKRKTGEIESEEPELDEERLAEDIPELPDEEVGEAATMRKQLEKLAKDKPEDFSKLLRTWLSED